MGSARGSVVLLRSAERPLWLPVCLSWLVALTFAGVASAQAPAGGRILLLDRTGIGAPLHSRFAPIDLYKETVKMERFPGWEQYRSVRDDLKHTYAGRKIDVIVTQDVVPVTFARRNVERFGAPSIVAVSFFDLYRGWVVAGLLVCLIQLALIVGLVTQRVWRRRAEAQTRKSEERYRSVVDTQSELVCRFLPDTTLTFVNDAYCRFGRKTRRQLLGAKFVEFVPPAARAAVLERIVRTRGIDSHEHQVTLPDGSIGWHHWINQPICDDRGRIIELQGVGRDITDRKRAEEALVQAEARNSAMLRAIPDLMFVLLRDGTYVDHHARDAKLLLVPPSAFIGRKVHEVMPPRLAGMLMDAIQRACESDEPIVVEYELPVVGARHFEARLARAGADRVLCMVRDVTESKRATELNRDLAGRLIVSQEAERQRVARELHDDLSQELALLNIEIDQLTAVMPSDGPRAQLQKVAQRAAEIATSIHNLSHDLHPSKLQTLGLVASMQSLCRDVKQKLGVAVDFTCDGAFAQPIDADVSLCLYRIMQEALTNIAKHSRAGDAWVRLSRELDDLVLFIADSGVGFDPDRGHGGGLGLLSMRERVSFLKGQLVIHAAPGAGTRIAVRIPLMSAARDAVPSSLKSA
jgi:PAS domain S-box-containing protein